MDTKKSNSINLHLRNGSILKFKPTGKGLYQYIMKKNETVHDIWSLMTTTNNDTFNVQSNSMKEITALRLSPVELTTIQKDSSRQQKWRNNWKTS